MAFKEGFGYQGVLLFDGKTEKVQCHLCGLWEGYLPNHLKKEHNMKAADYKEITGLRQSTALLSERQREKLIENGLEARKKNLISNKGHSEETKKKISESLKNIVREDQNRRGTCPDQLIDRLRKLHDKLGRTPVSDEITFYETLLKVHGSMKRACFLANIPHRESGHNLDHEYTLEDAALKFIELKVKNKKEPNKTDLFTNYKVVQRLGWKNIVKEVSKLEKKYIKLDGMRYDSDHLINFLKWFQEENKREAQASDCRRGLLPPVTTYASRFGSWKEAKELAYGT